METVDPIAIVSGSEKLTEIFGCWPSFHDAEVLEIHLSRGEVDPENEKYVFPTLTAAIHLWEMTNQVDDRGFFILQNHTLVELRFRDIEGLQIDGFNHQNVIDDIEFTLEQRGTYTDGSPLPPHIAVEFVHIFGLSVGFKCMSVEVVKAQPCSSKGIVS